MLTVDDWSKDLGVDVMLVDPPDCSRGSDTR